MSTITLNGKRVVSGSVTFPFYGSWSADLMLADASADFTDPAVTLVIGDLTVRGTVVRVGSFAGSLSCRVVGGAGGWRNVLPAKGYSHLAGVKLSSVLGDAAREAGEQITISPDRTLGSHWAREESKGEALLSLLLDGEWWVDVEGVTQMIARDSSPIVTPFTAIAMSGARGSFDIASESVAPWQPGRTFASSTITTSQTISSVTIEADNEGKLRLHVLTTSGAQERLRADIRSIIRSELASMSYAGEWEYSIAASIGMPGTARTVDCTPTDSRMPPLTSVPLKGLGVVQAPLAGTRCRIRFVNCNPSRPEVCSIEGTTEHLTTIEAVALLIYNFMACLLAAAGGGPLVAVVLQPLMGAAMTAALAAQAAPAPPGLVPQAAAALAVQAGFATGVAPSPATFAGWDASLSLLATKTQNVSGSFPSVGVPNG